MFKKAKLKLTALYVLMIFVITLSFSVFVYIGVHITTQNALEAQKRKIERRFALYREQIIIEPFNIEALQEIREKTIYSLLLVNLGILAISGVASYYLAEKTLEPIEEMLRKQKRFVSDASHELKTPLTAIKTDLEVTLRNKKLKLPEAKKAIEETILEIDEINVLANQLLRASKYESSSKKSKVHLEKIILASIKKLQHKANKKNIEIKSKLEPAEILANKTKLEELFINLIDNSIKYSNKDTKITVNAKSYSKKVCVNIKDEGIGISKEDLAHIFNPFYRSNKARTRKSEEGHGLGLTIAKQIIEEHNAEIKIDSKEGKGTTVTVSFNKVS